MDHTQSSALRQTFAPKNPHTTLEAPSRVVPYLEWLAQLPELSDRARLVYLLFENLGALKDKKAHPSLAYLAKRLCCSPSAARAAIRELEDEGLVVRHADRDDREWANGRQKSNVYELPYGPLSAASAARTVRTIRTVSTPGTDSTGPLQDSAGGPSNGLNASEDPLVEENERSNSEPAAMSSLHLEEIRAAFSEAQCKAIHALVRTVRPSPAALDEGVGRLMARRPDNPAGYLAVVLKGLANCAAEPTPVALRETPIAALRRKIQRIEQDLPAILFADPEKHARVSKLKLELQQQLRLLVVGRAQGAA